MLKGLLIKNIQPKNFLSTSLLIFSSLIKFFDAQWDSVSLWWWWWDGWDDGVGSYKFGNHRNTFDFVTNYQHIDNVSHEITCIYPSDMTEMLDNEQNLLRLYHATVLKIVKHWTQTLSYISPVRKVNEKHKLLPWTVLSYNLQNKGKSAILYSSLIWPCFEIDNDSLML